VLAHHYLTALELSRAAGSTAEVEELAEQARRYLALAGERALPLDVASAEASLAKALKLSPAGRPERPRLLERWARAAHQQGRLHEAKTAMEEAASLYRAQGEPVAAGRALSMLVTTLWALGDPSRRDVMAEAIAILEAQPPGRDLMAAYGELAGFHLVNGEMEQVIAAADRALQLAAALGEPPPGRALGFRGSARTFTGDRRGFDDLRQALERSLHEGKSRDAAVHHAHMAHAIDLYEGPDAALRASRQGLEFGERRGIAEFAVTTAAMGLSFLLALGRSAQALDEAEPLAERAEATGNFAALNAAQSVRFRLLAQRGRGTEAVATAAEELAARARGTGIPSELPLALAAAAQVLFAAGRGEASRSILHELQAAAAFDPAIALLAPELTRCALAVRDPELARRLVDAVAPRTPLAEHALVACRAQLAEAAGEQANAYVLYVDAAERWRELGNVPERAYALLGQGRSLAALGKPEAEAPLREARELFASMGYKPALAETEALLGEGEAAAV